MLATGRRPNSLGDMGPTRTRLATSANPRRAARVQTDVPAMHLIPIGVTAVLVLGPELVTAQSHRVEEASFLTVGGIEQ